MLFVTFKRSFKFVENATEVELDDDVVAGKLEYSGPDVDSILGRQNQEHRLTIV